MLPTDLGAARDLLQKAVDAVRDGGVLGDSELRDALGLTRELTRLVSQVQVETVAALDRSGAFAAEGYKRPDSAVANLLTVDRGRAAEITRAAARVCPRSTRKGSRFPRRCPRPRPCSPPGPPAWRTSRRSDGCSTAARHAGCHRQRGPGSRRCS